ncbi:MAG: sulfite exporter TauE/SafE family protein, partial [Halobacteriovoraceae bacterium]|nr:sulfite exporter TauE/SafE family protein [Halobacteriovoraceae bacterium]
MFPTHNFEILQFLFFCTAFFYSLVGFGGGSTYIALLAASGVSYAIVPAIALICNIIVVAGGTGHFIKNGQISFRFTFPFLLLSVPLAYLGGRIPIEKDLYRFILGIALLIAAMRTLLFKDVRFSSQKYNPTPPFIYASLIGGILGFVSGLVGIGGGIFLAPALYLFKW